MVNAEKWGAKIKKWGRYQLLGKEVGAMPTFIA